MDRPQTDPDALSAAVERIGFLEWRLEQVAVQLEAEREAVNQQRRLVADGARREAEAAERVRSLENRLAEARAEAARLGDRAAQAEKTRREIERQRDTEPTGERIADAYAKLLAGKRKEDVDRDALGRAQARIDRLERQQERFFERLVRWQHAAATGDRDAIDLAGLIAELRNETLRLSADHEAEAASNRVLRHALADAGVAPPDEPKPKPVIVEATPRWLKAPSGLPTPHAIDAADARTTLETIEDPSRRAQATTCFAALLDGDPDRAEGAVDTLLEAAREIAAPALVAALDAATTYEVKDACLRGLGTLDGPVAARALEAARTDRDWRIRAASIEAGVAAASAPGLILVEALKDTDPRVRRRAVLAASGSTRFDPTAVLLQVMDDEDPATRRAIATAIGSRGDDKALLTLTGALLDDDASVRAGVARVLGRRLGVALEGVATANERTRRTTAAELRERVSARLAKIDAAPATRSSPWRP